MTTQIHRVKSELLISVTLTFFAVSGPILRHGRPTKKCRFFCTLLRNLSHKIEIKNRRKYPKNQEQ